MVSHYVWSIVSNLMTELIKYIHQTVNIQLTKGCMTDESVIAQHVLIQKGSVHSKYSVRKHSQKEDLLVLRL